MCMPVSVATGGKVNGCVGLCKVWPQVVGMVVLSGGLIWSVSTGWVKSRGGEA